MQGSELKAIREALGWNQQQLADALDMSRVYVGQMERDQKPIERRTELAARWLGSQLDRAEAEERAARALCRLDGHPEMATMDGQPLWRDYLPEVRAVLEAVGKNGPTL